jgi:serine/threonine-protein phosphatase CPPED1
VNRKLFAAVTALCLLVLFRLPCAKAGPVPIAQAFDFVQMADPQIGFSDYAADLDRLQQAVREINALHPDLVVICGDLVNNANENSYKDFATARAGLKVSSHCAPGNHDVSNAPTPETLANYRRHVGKDYYSFEHKGGVFVIANTQLWKAPVPGESEKHDAWFKGVLAEAAREQKPVFVVGHYPPFEKEPDEPEAYFNWPLAKRKELLPLFLRSGVVAILAGHTHKTLLLDYHGIQIVTGETTSRNFDNRPFGFRLWHIDATRPFKHEFVPLDRKPAK